MTGIDSTSTLGALVAERSERAPLFERQQLAPLRELAGDYDVSRALCGTHRALLQALSEFELDLHQHIHEENNVLLPRARELIAQARPERKQPDARTT